MRTAHRGLIERLCVWMATVNHVHLRQHEAKAGKPVQIIRWLPTITTTSGLYGRIWTGKAALRENRSREINMHENGCQQVTVWAESNRHIIFSKHATTGGRCTSSPPKAVMEVEGEKQPLLLASGGEDWSLCKFKKCVQVRR